METDHNLPEFFKVYIRHLTFHQMLVPREFVDYLGVRKSGLAVLSSPCGQSWRVELVDDGKDLYFTDGWQNFVEDNLVRDGDFLFFKFHGDLTFSVMIYNESMCKEDDCSQGRDGFLNIGEEQNGVENATARPFQPEVNKIAEQTAISVKPSFEKCVSLCSLNIPKSFIREHSLSYKSYEKMVLRTSRNSSWEVKIIYKHGRTRLSAGWRAFLHENSIRAGDLCRFVLVDRLEMMVHIAN